MNRVQRGTFAMGGNPGAGNEELRKRFQASMSQEKQLYRLDLGTDR